MATALWQRRCGTLMSTLVNQDDCKAMAGKARSWLTRGCALRLLCALLFQEVGRGILLLGEGANRTSVGVNCLLIGAGSALLLWGVSQVLHARHSRNKDA
jgi:hypothetical protein